MRGISIGQLIHAPTPEPQQLSDEASSGRAAANAAVPFAADKGKTADRSTANTRAALTEAEQALADAYQDAANAQALVALARDRRTKHLLIGGMPPTSPKRSRLAESGSRSLSFPVPAQEEATPVAPVGAGASSVWLGTPIIDTTGQESADMLAPSAMDEGKPKETNVVLRDLRASMTAQGRGLQRRLSQSFSASQTAPGQSHPEASGSPAAMLAQAASASHGAAAASASTVGAFTAARSETAPSLSRQAPGVIEEASAARHEAQAESGIPSCYGSMAEWETAVKEMLEARKATGKSGFEPEQKAAMVELLTAKRMSYPDFQEKIMNYSRTSATLRKIVREVVAMRATNTLPAPWRPKPDAVAETSIPACYAGNMSRWKECVTQQIAAERADAKKSGKQFTFRPELKAAIVELFHATGMTTTRFQQEILKDSGTGGFVTTYLVRQVNQMRNANTLPPSWRPSQDDAVPGPSTSLQTQQ